MERITKIWGEETANREERVAGSRRPPLFANNRGSDPSSGPRRLVRALVAVHLQEKENTVITLLRAYSVFPLLGAEGGQVSPKGAK
jgi:hypothetical protein